MRVVCFSRVVLLLAAAFLTGGCYHYEYTVVSPSDAAQVVPSGHDLIVHRASLAYRLQVAEGHLVVRIFNAGPESIQFLGEQSTIVDPGGQSHPMRGQTIAGGAYMKLILPPVPHYAVYYPYTTVGIGFGYGWGWRHGGWYGAYWDDPYWYGPRYVPIYEPGESYWHWYGPGDVRLMLTFQHGADKPFTQSWTFDRHRRKGA